MTSQNIQLDTYKKFLLNRVTSTSNIVEYIENCSSSEEETAKHSFHKIMVHNWTESPEQLFDTLSEYFSSAVIPVNCSYHNDIVAFYTGSLNLVLKIIRFEFMFPYLRNMFSIDVLFNDKCSGDLFENKMTVEDIVAGVVSRRFNEKCELDLSNFCNDPEFLDKKVNFYKFALLAHFKILMLRIGRETKSLNLSNNNLSQAPLEVLNFFIKGDLTAINLSNNNIPSIQELLRVSSKIESLWIEGNPLCDKIGVVSSYVKKIIVKFPRLTELDGIKLNQHGMMFPFHQNYLVTPDKKTKMIVEKFLALYFSHYDSEPRQKIDMLYDPTAVLTVTTGFSAQVEQAMQCYTQHSRNMLNPEMKNPILANKRIYTGRSAITSTLCQFPETAHDPSTFTVDVLLHDKKNLLVIVDGIYKDKAKGDIPEQLFQFRRTFLLSIYALNSSSVYHIKNEIFNICIATKEQKQYSFQKPLRNMNQLMLIDPEPEDIEAISKIFANLTQLNKYEVDKRLKKCKWDIKRALKEFMEDLKVNKISSTKFVYEDDSFSDTSSLLDDVD